MDYVSAIVSVLLISQLERPDGEDAETFYVLITYLNILSFVSEPRSVKYPWRWQSSYKAREAALKNLFDGNF